MTNVIPLRGQEQERESLEARLAQAQKLAAVSQLAGGLAHDFNNLLGIVLGQIEQAEARAGGDPTLGEHLRISRRAAQHAAALTKGMLRSLREQMPAPAPLDLRAIVDGMLDLLQIAAGPAVKIEIKHNDALWLCPADPTEAQNVLLNLVANARDAMPHGGRIVIATDNRYVDWTEAESIPGARSGDFVTLTVADTGVGMTPEVRRRASEAFFTTKAAGKGSGLGLSIAKGFAERGGGRLAIESELGRGATVRIFLPRAASA